MCTREGAQIEVGPFVLSGSGFDDDDVYDVIYMFDFAPGTQLITRIYVHSDMIQHLCRSRRLEADDLLGTPWMGPYTANVQRYMSGEAVQKNVTSASEACGHSRETLEALVTRLVDLGCATSCEMSQPAVHVSLLRLIFTEDAVVLDVASTADVLSWAPDAFDGAGDIPGLYRGFEKSRAFSITSWANRGRLAADACGQPVKQQKQQEETLMHRLEKAKLPSLPVWKFEPEREWVGEELSMVLKEQQTQYTVRIRARFEDGKISFLSREHETVALLEMLAACSMHPPVPQLQSQQSQSRALRQHILDTHSKSTSSLLNLEVIHEAVMYKANRTLLTP